MGLHTVNDYSPQQAPSRQQPHSAPPPAASPGPAKSYVHIQNASYQVRAKQWVVMLKRLLAMPCCALPPCIFSSCCVNASVPN